MAMACRVFTRRYDGSLFLHAFDLIELTGNDLRCRSARDKSLCDRSTVFQADESSSRSCEISRRVCSISSRVLMIRVSCSESTGLGSQVFERRYSHQWQAATRRMVALRGGWADFAEL